MDFRKYLITPNWPIGQKSIVYCIGNNAQEKITRFWSAENEYFSCNASAKL